MGPGIAMECGVQNGLHIFEDHFYPEIINPKTLDVLPEGETGELVLTTLTRVGMPLIRFRTRDVTSIHHEICDCGRTLMKMSKITGRTDDMLKIRGVSVFPSQIEKVLLNIEGVKPHYQIIITRPGIFDEIEIKVEASPEIFFDNVKQLVNMKN